MQLRVLKLLEEVKPEIIGSSGCSLCVRTACKTSLVAQAASDIQKLKLIDTAVKYTRKHTSIKEKERTERRERGGRERERERGGREVAVAVAWRCCCWRVYFRGCQVALVVDVNGDVSNGGRTGRQGHVGGHGVGQDRVGVEVVVAVVVQVARSRTTIWKRRQPS